MNTQELTKHINSRIGALKISVEDIPSCGGGFEVLRPLLEQIKWNIETFIILLDEIENKEET